MFETQKFRDKNGTLSDMCVMCACVRVCVCACLSVCLSDEIRVVLRKY